jgi:hypothetical protein
MNPHLSDTRVGALRRQQVEAWGIQPELAAQYAAGNTSLFAGLLAAAQPHIRLNNCFGYPASFKPTAGTLCFPAPAVRDWPSCEQALRYFAKTGVMLHAPPVWQLASALHRAARGAGLPLFINQPDNLALGARAIAQAGMDAVVAEPGAAARLALHGAERSAAAPKLWFLVHPAEKEEWLVPAPLQNGALVLQEVHLYPGVPILIQCPALAQRPIATQFHTSPRYIWEYADAPAHITSLDDPLPLIRHRLPFALRAAGSCACGEQLFERT